MIALVIGVALLSGALPGILHVWLQTYGCIEKSKRSWRINTIYCKALVRVPVRRVCFHDRTARSHYPADELFSKPGPWFQ